MYTMSTLKERVEQAVAAGYTKTQLYKAAGVTSGAVSQWLSGRSKNLKAKSALGLERLTGWSADWWITGKAPRDRSEVAHDLRLDAFTVVPKITTIGELMQAESIPDLFTVEMPDAALEPRIERGTRLLFDKNASPSPGCGVLVKDSAGGMHIRRYVQAPGGAWTAQAVNDAYLSLGHNDGATVVAVMTGKLSGTV